MRHGEYDAIYARQQLKRSRNPLRQLIKRFYIANILKDVRGPTIDFGCGAGQLLERLPQGSLGLEVNPHLVEALEARGMNVRLYDTDQDQFSLRKIPENTFETLVLSHVVEHFDNAARDLGRILESCHRIGIGRVIVVVPGKKGYGHDSTHRTFVDRDYLKRHHMTDHAGFVVSDFSYFPVDRAGWGEVLTYHELKVVYDAA